jgi:glycosyltransferase involved in cell wall biosynthesis
LAPPRWAGPTVSAVAWASRVPGRHGIARAWTALRARTPRIREAVESAAVVLAPTRFLHGRLALLGIAPTRLRVVPFGIAPPDPGSLRTRERADADGRLRIAFAGSLVPGKGAHLLLEAMAQAPGLSAEVDIFGGRSDDRYAALLERIAGDDRRIRFAGVFADGEFGAILARTDVLVIPSLWYENSPLVLLEALAHRCPVIVADVPGLVEPMRPEVDGWQFKRGDAGDLAQRLAFVASRRDTLTAVRRAPHATRSFDDYMTELLTIYDDLAGQPRMTA